MFNGGHMTKHTPATPLPWSNPITHGVSGRIDPVCVADRGLDATYIAHAANAYPKLVEALRTLQTRINACELGPVHDGRAIADEMESECETSRALLRELGE